MDGIEDGRAFQEDGIANKDGEMKKYRMNLVTGK